MATRNNTQNRPSGKRRGAEVRAAAWLARHPGVLATPTAVTTSVLELGPVTTGSVAAGLLTAAVAWRRIDPDTYHRHAAPRFRAVRRRWTRYHGYPWRRNLDACELTRIDRRTGAWQVPRVLKVTSPTPTIDVVTVKLCRGQSVRTFQGRRDELAAALGAEVLAIENAKPRVITITAVYGNPFTEIVPAVEIPDEAHEVDLTALELGDTEHGQAWSEPLLGNHWLVHGATGSGKGGLLWNPLRAMGPMIRDGLVKVWMIDPKGGMETEQGRPLFHRYATSTDPNVVLEQTGELEDETDAMVALITRFRDAMKQRQELLRDQGLRKVEVSAETPLHVLMIDELAMLTALGGRNVTYQVNKLLGEIMTQGRAAGFAVCAYVQEPTKDIVPIRDLFTVRICLRTTSSDYVDMVLGDHARLRGAIADEIPMTEDYAGIGYRITNTTRTPIRVRAGLVTDEDIAELVTTCTPLTRDDGDDPTGVVVPIAA
ncbi:cell division protein FtsK [Amycolatopsis sp. K13G38]|uniref:Cell division protein FtsK n=1 Tax=Amycolatopsis acididurans TaxID=2724524 RepID=A0ABX1J0L4_9PSEU|nr:FtsK/SpoIIIE domain-containing protein [Amycolatopsis acididurans]NKQ53316.1 cell division protein FtsK [Amycolatopsis acididurans]